MNQQDNKRAIALGFFDGVHIGHSKLLQRTAEVAAETGLRSTVLTFDRHPASEITGIPTPLINTMEDREYILRTYFGMDEIIFLPFDSTLMHMPWRDFIYTLLAETYQAGYLIAGWDYHFGYKGEGNPARLLQEANQMGIGCEIVPEVTVDGVTVSSTRIRSLIAQGDMEKTAQLLGHPHIFSAQVAHGKRLGRTLGIPTINMPLPSELQEPAFGVYATRVILDETGAKFTGVTNVGVNPTVAVNGKVLAETHIIGFDGDLYGKTVRLEFIKYLRPEIKFSGVEEMKNRIFRDIETVRANFPV